MKIPILIVLGLLFVSIGYAASGVVILKVNLISQDPYPAQPGSYANLVFKIENFGQGVSRDTQVQLVPKYPFSFDEGVSTIQSLGKINAYQTDSNAYLVRYRVKVDSNAVTDDYEMELKFLYNNAPDWLSKTVNVSVEDSQTDFDVILQDSSTQSSTLAIANIGKNTAQAVIVKIPEQPRFFTTGASASIIGNLAAGDYTFVTFQLSSLAGNASFSEDSTQSLLVDVDYTDSLGVRRTLTKEVAFNSLSSNAAQRFSGDAVETRGSSDNIYIIIGVVGIVAVVAFFKFRKGRKP
jgi:hypothetical protein